MQPKGRKRISATIFAAAGMVLVVGGLVQPAIATAERIWDLEVYDNCIKNSTRPAYICCLDSGGDWVPSPDGDKCVAPVNAQSDPVKPAPGSLGVPGTVHTRPGKVSTQP